MGRASCCGRLAVLVAAFAMWMLGGEVEACPFYQSQMSGRVNFTTFDEAYTAATTAGDGFALTVYVCNKARIMENETIPALTSDVMVEGAPGEAVYLNIDEKIQSPIFVVSGLGTLVSFRSVRIVFLNELFLVTGGAHLALEDVQMWGGETALTVDTTGGVSTGATLVRVQFHIVGVAILMEDGPVSCTTCLVNKARTAGLITRDDFSELAAPDIVFVDTLIPYGTQATPTSDTFISPLSDAFVAENPYINCNTYEDSSTTDPSFGSGGGGGGGSKDAFSYYEIVTLVLLLIIAAATVWGTAVFLRS